MGISDRGYYQDDVPSLRPWDRYSMVTNLIIINVVVLLANLIFTNRSDAIVKFLELRSGDLFRPWDWYRLLTYGFVHAPDVPSHILFNMLSLYFLGQAVEQRYGRWEFLRIYLLTIVFGGLLFCLIRALSPGPQSEAVIGASGAVIAVVMLFVYNYPQATLMIWGVLPVKAWVVGVITVVLDVFGTGGAGTTGGGGVAYDVHFAGFLFATVYYFAGFNFAALSFERLRLANPFKRKPKLRVHKAEEESPSRDEIEADRILDKIYREGQSSLTPKEQQFLENYSRRVRQKRK